MAIYTDIIYDRIDPRCNATNTINTVHYSRYILSHKVLYIYPES